MEPKGLPDVASPTGDRIAALTAQLAEAHQELRRRLAALKDGRLGPDDLRSHCPAFCTALTTHHQGEDNGLFTALLRERPDLAPTITKLIQDHDLITHILTRIADLAEGNPAAHDRHPLATARPTGAAPVTPPATEPTGAPQIAMGVTAPTRAPRTAPGTADPTRAPEVAAGPSDRTRAPRTKDSSGAPEAIDPDAIRRELDGLTAIMESHFRYEERALHAALAAGVPDTGWSDPVLRLRPPG
ncbi:hypothetical protein BJY16_004564 [Actinoplanes octamycinicus]|uniref:Hemerythrin-like domain-containing protein n=1 Tax=Actinoplanes octamycinicus TaxID=135948 RepID=A0A7W7M8S2_9ACTN|nr:hemerythrin domain-containing protein [Actinoplanes octamycinicus]MBB4741105.1 hypothetical protein [Actinoplanes octamycinicus]GIE56010.1 hypothetical protein Aoc01nite_14120 [Actinoplanes octamycinicus]